MKVRSGEKGYGIIDTLITLILIAILIGVLIPRYEKTAKAAQESALQMGLQNIRMAVSVYRMVNHRYPDDLKDMVNKRYILPVREDTIFTSEYLRTLAVDEEGYPLDPFGNRYYYDKVSGRVSSTTKGYEQW